jgi:hypothetical protein
MRRPVTALAADPPTMPCLLAGTIHADADFMNHTQGTLPEEPR